MHMRILIGNDPRLRQKAQEVRVSDLQDHTLQAAIDDLFETMHSADGLGLAAPQVGLSKRIVIVVQGETALCLVNPVITKRSKELRRGEEGCLSFPGLFGKVTRHRSISVTALDRHGKPLNFEARDLDARVIQHELDHLEGILLPDRLAERSEAPAATESRRSL